jgi:sodium transport system permease protein
MKPRDIAVVYRKELRDMLRDRRTIIAMVVVPVLVMPALMLGMGTAAAKLVTRARQEIPKVMVLGGEDSPKTLSALKGLKTIEVLPSSDDYTNLISEKKIRAAVKLPKGFDAGLQSGDYKVVEIYVYAGEMKSGFGAETVENFFQRLREQTVRERVTAQHFPEKLLKPFEVRQTNVAPPKKVSGNLIGAIIPYLLILTCMMGAMHPAVDLTAGEKERGTMETLLCSPVGRTHLVLGKCLAVLTTSAATTLLSLSSTGICFALGKRMAASGGLALPLTIDAGALAAVFLMMLPLAIFFSATMVAIGLFSRSSKEANSYVQPLLVITIMPAVASLLPGAELNARLALVPVVNISLVSKELLSGTCHWNYIAVIFGSTCVYATLAVVAAVALFKREGVLFRT